MTLDTATTYSYMRMTEYDDFEAATELFKALASPTRLRILSALSEKPLCVHELTEILGVRQPLVSQHLRILRSAHLLAGQRNGKEIIYSLMDGHVSEIINDALTHSKEKTSK